MLARSLPHFGWNSSSPLFLPLLSLCNINSHNRGQFLTLFHSSIWNVSNPSLGLMHWINKNTPRKAVFSTDMGHASNIVCSTGRRVTNHPHYERYSLLNSSSGQWLTRPNHSEDIRNRTEVVYRMYECRPVEEVYNVFKELGTDYIMIFHIACKVTLPFWIDRSFFSSLFEGQSHERTRMWLWKTCLLQDRAWPGLTKVWAPVELCLNQSSFLSFSRYFKLVHNQGKGQYMVYKVL